MVLRGSDGRVAIVALIGVPGAGKSTLARLLASSLEWRIVSRDTIRAAMFPQCSYTPLEKRAGFRAALLALEVNAALGASSILDGVTLARERDRLRVALLADRRGAVYLPLHVRVSSATARTRIANDLGSPHPASNREPALVDEVLGRFDPVGPEVAVLDGELAPARVLDQALDAIQARLA